MSKIILQQITRKKQTARLHVFNTKTVFFTLLNYFVISLLTLHFITAHLLLAFSSIPGYVMLLLCCVQVILLRAFRFSSCVKHVERWLLHLSRQDVSLKFIFGRPLYSNARVKPSGWEDLVVSLIAPYIFFPKTPFSNKDCGVNDENARHIL